MDGKREAQCRNQVPRLGAIVGYPVPRSALSLGLGVVKARVPTLSWQFLHDPPLASVVFSSCAAVVMLSSRSFILLSLFVGVLGAPPFAVPTAGQSIDLKRRPRPVRNETGWSQWSQRQRNAVMAKYRVRPHAKRATGENLYVARSYDIRHVVHVPFSIVDQGYDSK